MLIQNSMTVNPQEPDAMLLTAQAYKFDHIYVDRRMGSWHWIRRYESGKLESISTTAFPTQLRASRAAAIVAHCEGVPFKLSRCVYEQLAAMWNAEGTTWFDAKQPIEICWNRHQREGYLGAMEESEAERSAHPLMGD